MMMHKIVSELIGHMRAIRVPKKGKKPIESTIRVSTKDLLKVKLVIKEFPITQKYKS